MSKPVHLCWACDKNDICRYRYLFEDFMDADIMNDVHYADDDTYDVQAGIVVCKHYIAYKEAPDAEQT